MTMVPFLLLFFSFARVKDAFASTMVHSEEGTKLFSQRRPAPGSWGAIHQCLRIILKLRILVLIPVSTMPYVVEVKNFS
jgi:hypothetical protein